MFSQWWKVRFTVIAPIEVFSDKMSKTSQCFQKEIKLFFSQKSCWLLVLTQNSLLTGLLNAQQAQQGGVIVLFTYKRGKFPTVAATTFKWSWQVRGHTGYILKKDHVIAWQAISFSFKAQNTSFQPLLSVTTSEDIWSR